MKKKCKNNIKRNAKQNLDELVKRRPILTKEEMDSFMTYDEIISEAKRLFDEAVLKIWKEHDSNMPGN